MAATIQGDVGVDNLFPAIGQSFVVILIGYVFGRFRIVEPSEARSISVLVGKLALPALLFKNLAILDLVSVSWRFLASILIAKFSIFLLVTVISYIVIRPWNIGKAGLYGIFTTQSNDFALGLPIVRALYGKNYVPGKFYYYSYIYLVAPVSLLIINPLGFFMLEYSKQVRDRSRSVCRQLPALMLRTFRGVVLNPIIFMTVAGVITNVFLMYVIKQPFPDWLGGFLDILGGAYSLCALFSIGIFMVGKIKAVSGKILLVCCLLIVAKSVILPLFGYVLVKGILPDGVLNATANDLSSFAFLYCTFPTAPTVFIYASQFNTAMTIIASGLVFGTILSAPVMYVSARMAIIQIESIQDYINYISYTKKDICLPAILCLVWVFVSFMLARRYRSYLHVIVMHIMVASFLATLFVTILEFVEVTSYWTYLIFAIFFIGVFASRVWMAWLTVALLVIKTWGLSVAEKIWLPLLISGWGVPMVCTIFLVSFTPMTPTISDSNVVNTSLFLFGTAQLVISVLFLSITFLLGVGCLIAMMVIIKRRNRNEMTSLGTNVQQPTSYGSTLQTVRTSQDKRLKEEELEEEEETESRLTASSSPINSPAQRAAPGAADGDDSITRFVVLELLLLLSTLVGILTVFWKLSSKDFSGIFIAVNILDTVANFGQGFAIFIIFGFEKYWFWVAIYEKVRRLLFKVEHVYLPDQNELSNANIILCNTFRMEYMEECKEAIVSDKRFLFKQYRAVFCGNDLVSWMVARGLAQSRETAVTYGQNLLEGRVIAHVEEEHYFHDESFFYRFLDEPTDQ